MSTGLSFIVFGVPRSGTKGLLRALNLHPHVLCAQERFDYRLDHSRAVFPDAFLDGPVAMDRLQRRKLQGLRAAAAAKPDIRFVGNKHPRYYLTLDRINREVPNLHNIVIYRSPYGFMPSWDRKEAEHKVARGHAGAVGLFGFLDLLVCLPNVMRQGGVFVFPYHLGLNVSPDPLLSALDFIGAEPERVDLSTFATKHLPKRAGNGRRIALEPYERAFLTKLRVGELDELLSGNWGVMTPGTAAQLEDYLSSIRPMLPEAIDHAFAECSNPAALYYGASYVHSNRQELAGLLRMTEGSRFIAEMQRFGLPRRLKHIYFQRSWAVRRLTRLRTAAS